MMKRVRKEEYVHTNEIHLNRTWKVEKYGKERKHSG
jgi:hypothetical protein